MDFYRITNWIVLVAAAVSTTSVASGQQESADVVIYGGTSAAVIAALQVKQMGRSVLIVCPEQHLGGLTSSGLGWTDTGNKQTIGGLTRVFYQRIKQHYDTPEAWRQQRPEQFSRYHPDDDAMWVFEPHVAEATYESLIEQSDIGVFRNQWLDRAAGVEKAEGRIVSITTLAGKSFVGKAFIDATYEGDLMAAAGVEFHVGRESNEVYGETLNGVQTRRARSHQFTRRIDPYRIPADPTSGLLPRIHGGGPGQENKGDHRVQAYNYRLCLTNVPSNRIAFPKPDGYDAWQYELLLRTILAPSANLFVFGKFDPIPNHKTDTNNHGPFSTDNIGMNYDYPTASYERRREILKEHESYQKGYFYFLCNDPRVPADISTKMSQWGLAKDEFQDNGYWPRQIYVREARRMIGDFVVTESHLRRTKPTLRPIGLGSYNMDSHNVQRYVARGKDGTAFVRNEGDIQINPGGPYPIDFGAILPKRGDCVNLLVPVAVSSSHIAYGSIRMEPVFMILGQSAATAAVIAIEEGVAVQDVSYRKLKTRLENDGQVLELAGAAVQGNTELAANLSNNSNLPNRNGILVDDQSAKLEGNWQPSTAIRPFVGSGYFHDGHAADGMSKATFVIKVPKAGRYKVRLVYTPHPMRATNVPVVIRVGDQRIERTINQQRPPEWWGPFDLDQSITVSLSNVGTNQHVVVDAALAAPED